MSTRYALMGHSHVIALGFAVATAVGVSACFRAPRAAEEGIPPRTQVVAACGGEAWVDINNTGNIPVDVYASYRTNDEVMLGTVPPGRLRIPLTRTPVSALTARAVGQRTILEATTAPHPGTDRVQYMPGCKPNETGAD